MTQSVKRSEQSSATAEEHPSKKTPLYREEAVLNQTRRLEGEVILVQSVRLRVFALLAMVVVAAGLIFVSTATYARMESVEGWVVPEGGLIRVAARQGGVIEEISVSEGQEVAAGEALAVLRLSSDLGDGYAGLLLARQLEAEIEAAHAQAAATREKLVAEQEQVAAQRAALARELAEERLRLATVEQQVELLQHNVERSRGLAERGVLTQSAFEDVLMRQLVARDELSQLRTSLLGYERQIGDLDARQRSLPLDIEVAEAEARMAEAALAQKQTEAAIRHNYVVGASVPGRVVALPVSKGQDVTAGALIAALTPAGSKLEVELFVPSRAAGFIQSGQEVRLMYQAFPYQKFGTTRGSVQHVSMTVLSPDDVTVPGLQLQEPVFRVKVDLEREAISAYGQEISIQPGMLLSADVIIDRRTLLEWLLDPIYAVGRMG